MPPLFALGYHQCRWNYRSEDDVLSVDEGFDRYQIPYDVIWLDIEHTDGKRYFTWDKHNFPTPEKMHAAIEAKGRKIVVITDPHIKRAPGYYVHDQATKLGHYVKTESGSDYEGHCWPGTSSWVDFTSPAAREWYSSLFTYDIYQGSSPITYFWIDMNEPSVFSGHEVTMDRKARHVDNRLHEEVHNLYGYYMNMATYHGVLRRSAKAPHETPTRPFILSRSFFAGTQKYCAVWTGDNKAEWSHLAISVPMLLGMSLAGLPFVGADVGGFFGNPETELLVRWYQLGAFYPFFRAHAHLETARREPWLFGEENTRLIRAAILQRYALLPFIYTTFYLAARDGTAVLNPLFFEWPSDPRTFEAQDSMLVGDALLVRPVVTPKSQNNDQVPVYLPGGPSQQWFDLLSGFKFAEGGKEYTVSAPISKIPVFIRGGRIIPRQERARRSSLAMQHDPYTLVVALDKSGQASGSLYLDDGHSFLFTQGAFVHRKFTFKDGVLRNELYEDRTRYTSSSNVTQAASAFVPSNWVERVVIYGLAAAPKSVTLDYTHPPAASDLEYSFPADSIAVDAVSQRQELEFLWEPNKSILVIRRPGAPVRLGWSITVR
eukprot:NODE_12_length_2886_cov_80.128305_g9_i0.p1 GENE.NODE_12_length_2886_cov_80.128305_g9_i0~~NODE_12_length_2886_cov_80.128305_g9_i0.p1  ORF type:complete len:602 (-),score=201.67 NODE_12_length_2886_cov_80.128305_g9_i0:281-2086(-)